MEDEKLVKAAKNVFADICAMLDGHKWTYDKNEKDLRIHTDARGDDLSIQIDIHVDVKRQLAILHSPMPFDVPASMRREMAVAVTCANHGMVDGDFDYNYENGKIYFRLTTSYRNSRIDREVFDYVLNVSCNTIDDYNDKFLAVVEQRMSIAEIRNFIQ